MTLSTETSPGRRLLGRSFSDSAIRHIIAIAVATLVIFFWIMFLRSSADISGIELRTPDIEIVDPYLWGITVQEMVVPITLLFLLSRTALFRRIITAPTVSKIPMRDLAWLVSVLALIQVLVIASERWQIVTLGSQVTLGLFITFVAGLIGG
ncbi:MAG: hypothetical protein KAG66_05420, partial [Methylococcales bacterium]|nr:hypothetical protein [Methylococcales bacterium]